MNFSKITYLLMGLATIMVGCSSTQLAQVPQTRENFNQAIDVSENEQFLLNIIRMHDGRSPYFVGVDSITTQSTVRARVEAQLFDGAGGPTEMAGPFWNVGPTVEFTEAPTITYSPLQGSKFVSSMMMPLNSSRIVMLRSSGWGLPNILKLTVNRIGSLDNSRVSRHVVDDHNDENQDFNKFIDGVTALSAAGKIEGSITNYNGMPAILMHTTDQASGATLSKLLHLKGNYSNIILSRHTSRDVNTPENVVDLQTRSFLGIMNYVSYGIHDKESDNEAQYSTNAGQFYVLTSNIEPLNVTVKVNYKGKWYYIANNDTKSKATLVLLKLIYSLQVGDLKTNLPVVTIPVR
ncbi:MAG: hypothetical protein K2Y14_03755 [Burkholderiales bacterium]|nr:hypothetical protein [Burkholderiales bacterium]MBX9890430.1 hypothetical protein [Amoebophilaceae bacterium]